MRKHYFLAVPRFCAAMRRTNRLQKPTAKYSELPPHSVRTSGAFTLIELIVVMAIIAMLLTLAVPRYFHSIDRAKEAVLRHDLAQLRDSIDKYYSERGHYPDSLEDLVARNYLRKIPPDPITDSTTTWLTVAPDEAGQGNVFNVKSGAPGLALDGSKFIDW